MCLCLLVRCVWGLLVFGLVLFDCLLGCLIYLFVCLFDRFVCFSSFVNVVCLYWFIYSIATAHSAGPESFVIGCALHGRV